MESKKKTETDNKEGARGYVHWIAFFSSNIIRISVFGATKNRKTNFGKN